jgi:hypothetical protein
MFAMFALGALVLAGGVDLSGSALANDCGPGCSQTKSACLAAARMQYLADRTICRDIHETCREVCTPAPTPGPGPDAGCVGECGRRLGQCARDAAAGGRDCVRGCKANAPKDRAECIDQCIDHGAGDPSACSSEFADCVERCGGSPGPAFIDVTAGTID